MIEKETHKYKIVKTDMTDENFAYLKKMLPIGSVFEGILEEGSEVEVLAVLSKNPDEVMFSYHIDDLEGVL